MKRRGPTHMDPPVVKALAALGGEATLGDVVVLAAVSRREVEAALERLIAEERAQVRVSESGEVVYRLEGGRPDRGGPGRGPGIGRARRTAPPPTGTPRAGASSIPFDRKTLRLIRARDGVLSLAELVEHTGLPLTEARQEMRRLAGAYGGEPHASLDGHVVWAFPEVMTSVHGRFHGREPRPAWIRFNDPMRWGGPMARVLAGSLLVERVVRLGRGLLRGLGVHRAFRFRQRRALRRYALGHVFETALAGKGIVSLSSTTDYLESRAGGHRVSRRDVEAVLRGLAGEFDALITREGREIFFGFRNVKRQFLASELVRRRLRLGRTASGRTVFDSGDSRRVASERELDAFDRVLGAPVPPSRTSSRSMGRGPS